MIGQTTSATTTLQAGATTRLFILEYLCGCGPALWPSQAPGLSLLDPQLLQEGLGMWSALVQDWVRVPGVQVVTLLAADLEVPAPLVGNTKVELHRSTTQAARECLMQILATVDALILVAPEIDDVLSRSQAELESLLHAASPLRGANRTDRRGLLGSTWSPDLALIELASDKHATCRFLGEHQVRVPSGQLLNGGQPWPVSARYPAIWKPLDGCGSQGLTVVHSPRQAALATPWDIPGRLEERIPGLACSVLVLTGLSRSVLLHPCVQCLHSEDWYYQGGKLMEEPALVQRAHALAQSVVELVTRAFPKVQGMWGMDLILGDCPRGERDYVIELNPRVCSSYLGLRAACDQNLAEAWHDLLLGVNRPAPTFRLPHSFDLS